MKFSDQLEQRFATMVTHYPTKRSVLVPMLLYIQDELGARDRRSHSRDCAARWSLSELEVRNVISYYSMLRTHPIGKYNLQVCTNVSCLLRGADDIFEHCKKKLGVGNKQSTPDGLFHRGGSRVHRGLLLGAGADAELRVSREPDAGKIDELIDGLKKKEQQ